MFSLQGVDARLGSRVVLSRLSLDLPAGRVIGLIGPNGSGKSTLIRLLARQLEPVSGRILYRDRPLSGFKQREYARLVAHMPQFTPPAEGVTARELVALGRYPWHGPLGRFGPVDRALVERAMERTGVAFLAERMVDTLSGGERQRVWLAMMLAQDGTSLLLDEPTSALDIAHQVEVLSLARVLCREDGLSVLMVLHDVNMAARYCDVLVALRDGRVIARGTPSEIVQPSCLRDIYGLSMVVFEGREGHPHAIPA